MHDPQMRHGHKAAVVATDTQLITSVDVLTGNALDNLGALELAEQSEASAGVPVEEAIGDRQHPSRLCRRRAQGGGAKECQQVGLFGGENTVKVRVTAGDSTAKETHTVVVIRDKVLVSNVGQCGLLLQSVGGNDIG